MALQSGVFYFDGGAVHKNAMTQSANDVWSGNRRVETPDVSTTGLALTWEGRLDNRDDLLLRIGSSLRRDANDSAIALAVFERFGIDGLRLLVGDWSIVVWDRACRTIHLARDYMGARPLYYCVVPDFVAWSTDLGELVRRCGRSDALNEAFVVAFLTLNPTPDVTPYESIHAVPPGTSVSFPVRGDMRNRRFWNLDAGRIRYSDKRTYEEHLRQLWIDAVGVRLRTTGTVWAELSGGLDSSSVVCMADWLLKSSKVPAQSIRMVSHATLQSPEGDERRFIAEVERQVGVRSEIVGVEDHQEESDPHTAWVSPYASQGVGLASMRRVRDRGGRLVLSGRMGDVVMGCQPDNSAAVLDDFLRGRTLSALSNIRAWSRSTRKPFIEIAWRLLVPPRQSAADTGVTLLTPRLRAMAREAEMPAPANVRASQRDFARMVLGYALSARLDVPYHAHGLIHTYPFSHRPLVEFMLSIPSEELSAPGDTRSLMRRAFADFVPARILRRVSKGYYPPAAFRAARQMAASLSPVGALHVVQRGWIDAARLRDALRVLNDGGGETGGDIHSVLRLERWLKAREAIARIPQREEVDTNAVLDA